MQQYLPFTVLKHKEYYLRVDVKQVATVLTVYGIETTFSQATCNAANAALQQYLPFTVLKRLEPQVPYQQLLLVATVLTVYGIETDCY